MNIPMRYGVQRRNNPIKWDISGSAALLPENEKVLPLLAEFWDKMQEIEVSPGSPVHTS